MKSASLAFSVTLAITLAASDTGAHEGHHDTTYEITSSASNIEKGRHLKLMVTDTASGKPIAARFSLSIDGQSYIPKVVNQHGLRFVSIHRGKRQQIIVTYVRGSGHVIIPIPDDAKTGTIAVTKGFEYRNSIVPIQFDGQSTSVEIKLTRWVNLTADGWHAADEHLHYERQAPRYDKDWLTMLRGDGLSHAHFMVLKGGNVPGTWAQQFQYGRQGESRDGVMFLRPGEEYRDSTQGHINLLGIQRIIEPISTGGIGSPTIKFNYPPLLRVLQETQKQGGIGGPAHGGLLAKSSTSTLDTIMGGVEFFEIANSHLLKTDIWYLLMNAGFIVPPMAGTDLPNFGFRDSWQPFLGEIRTYVRSGERIGFDGWKKSVKEGEVFITSGPIIKLSINGSRIGGVVRLPAAGSMIEIEAELSSPRKLETLEIVSMGQPLSVPVESSLQDGIHRIKVKHRLRIQSSCWIAARGTGGPKEAIERGLGIKQNEIAHTGIIRVIVGDQPIRSEEAVSQLAKQLHSQQEFYRAQGKFEKSEDRMQFLKLFDEALDKLEKR